VFNLFVRNHRTRDSDTTYNIIISADIPQKAPDRKVSQLNEKFRQYIISYRPVTRKAIRYVEVNSQIQISYYYVCENTKNDYKRW
jgi:hypothetical protein